MKKELTIAVIGSGPGGATAAALLQRAGFRVKVFEQTLHFQPTGAGIHLTPNVLKALRPIGADRYLLERGCRPSAFTSRSWDSGELLFSLSLGDVAEQRYGGAYLTVHRADFQQALVAAVEPGSITYGKKLESLENSAEGVRLRFKDGYEEVVDLVIGADGLSSRSRQILQGEDPPTFAGQVAYRSVFPASALKILPTHDLTKWWAPDRFVIAYYLTRTKDCFYFVAGFPAIKWPHKTRSVAGSLDELLGAFAGFHPEVRAILQAGTEVSKWPLFERPPNPVWYRERVVLLGDACHPMSPHMAQGAAMAVEDAAILTRCLTSVGASNWKQSFQMYTSMRTGRTSRVQAISSQNRWLREPSDPGWVFDYDVWKEPLPLLEDAIAI